MNSLLQARTLMSLIVVAVVGLLGYALYTEHVTGLEPCPLCMSQRIAYAFAGLFALLAVLHNPAALGYRLYAGLTLIGSGAGAAIAGRQVWMQHLPADQVPACGPGLDFMLDTFPLGELLHAMLMGDGNCAEVVWTFMGLSMPTWSLICFIGLIAVSLRIMVKPGAR